MTAPTNPSAALSPPFGTVGTTVPNAISPTFGFENIILMQNVMAIIDMRTRKKNSSFLTPK